ncbi:hypothetical protein NM688_g4517 [Phlebia brevispora]|uniref:Uncharacterized protein n=1 Tax=Phlebia brevispora TaxID=194682 RepID=A0ACC1T2F1_9APHY|nr:hypothetical protein NM688_g4517 [Phlebia brevispora]
MEGPLCPSTHHNAALAFSSPQRLVSPIGTLSCIFKARWRLPPLDTHIRSPFSRLEIQRITLPFSAHKPTMPLHLVQKARAKKMKLLAHFSPKQKSLAYRCLVIEEIFEEIVSQVYDDGNDKCTLSALSLTCKAFEPVATRFLWRDLRSEAPLVKLFNHTIALQSPEVFYKTDPWAKYAHCVKTLRTANPGRLDPLIDRLLRQQAKNHERNDLLPNLQSLHFSDVSKVERDGRGSNLRELFASATTTVVVDASLKLMRNPTLLSFEDVVPYLRQVVDEAMGTHIYGLFNALRFCPWTNDQRHIESLTFHIDTLRIPDVEDDYTPQTFTCAAPAYILPFPLYQIWQGIVFDINFTHFDVSSPLTDDVLLTLAKMPTLRSLHFLVSSNQNPIDPGSMADIFPKLESLHLGFMQASESVVPFFQSLQAPVLRKLVIEFLARLEPSTDTIKAMLQCVTDGPYHDTLMSLTLKAEPWIFQNIGPRLLPVYRAPLDADTFIPLFQRPLQHLTRFCVVHSTLRPDDTLVHNIGEHYPQLQELMLCPPMTSLWGVHKPKVSLHALHALCRFCPSLETLWLSVDIPFEPKRRQYYHEPCLSLRRWYVVCSDNPRRDGHFPEYLFDAFPTLERVRPMDPRYSIFRLPMTLTTDRSYEQATLEYWRTTETKLRRFREKSHRGFLPLLSSIISS